MFQQQLLKGKLNSPQNYRTSTFSSSTPKFWDQFDGCICFQEMQLRTVLRCLWSWRSNLAIFKSLRKVGEPLSQISHFFFYFRELNLYLQTCNHPQTLSPRRPSASLLYLSFQMVITQPKLSRDGGGPIRLNWSSSAHNPKNLKI